MDILLTHGYFLHEDPFERKIMRPYPPLGILCLSSYLKSRGFSAAVLDTTFSSSNDVFAKIREMKPGIVGIYCNLMTKPNVLRMIRTCKNAGATVILGGPEPPHYAEEYLQFGADVIVLGEGERTLEELIPHLQKHGAADLQKIAGIAFLGKKRSLVRTASRPLLKQLDDLPFPDRAAIDMQKYISTWQTHHGHGSVSLICARGCPYTCTWCSHSVYGVSHRRRSPQNVADEVELIVATYKPDMLWYADDVFTIHHRWFFEYAQELQNRNLRVPFECISREDRLNEEVVKTLAAMGCFRLWIGSESGSQEILNAMQRRTDVDRVQEMSRLLQRYGIEAGMFIMLGYEGETQSDLQATVKHLKKAQPDIFLTTVSYPIKGTQYYEEVADKISSPKSWLAHTDRDFVVHGRHSDRYYRYANRWLVNEVNLHRQMTMQNGKKSMAAIAKTFVNARIGRVGMALTRNERT
jgi:radical SAM superfamily enzyme YgiQ (UPF0313 family)